MADIVDKKTRSRMMSGIRGKDTAPEIAVRRFLFDKGYRFRLHSRTAPGRPDIVLPKLRTAILVHGCFWHRHPGCRFAYTPRTNLAFWNAKFEANVQRDKVVRKLLVRAGWRTHVIWECQLKGAALDRLARKLEKHSKERERAGPSPRRGRKRQAAI